MDLSKYILSLAFIIGWILPVIAQNAFDIKVKKPTHEFFYKGKPVSPLALVGLFPSPDNGSDADTIDLNKYPFIEDVKLLDTLSFSWRNKYQQQRSYILFVKFDSTFNRFNAGNMDTLAIPSYLSYTVIDTTSGAKFVIMAQLYRGSELAEVTIYHPVYLFILDIKEGHLIKLWGVKEKYDSDGLPVKIKGNILTNGRDQYKIPASAL